MKIFISYKYTDIPKERLHKNIDPIVEHIIRAGHYVFCNLYSDDFYRRENYTTKDIMEDCFTELDKCDIYIAYVDNIFGGGMAIECGYACALGKKIVSFLPKVTNEKFTTLKGLSSEIYYYEDDLLEKMEEFVSTIKQDYCL